MFPQFVSLCLIYLGARTVFSVQPTLSPIQLAKIALKKLKRASGNPSSKKSTKLVMNTALVEIWEELAGTVACLFIHRL